MATISKKLFVNVLTGTTAPANADENKIYFIKEAKKIYAKGVYYGVSDDDFAAYKKALGTFLDNQDAADYQDVPAAIAAAITTIDGKVTASKTLKIDGDAYELAASVAYDADAKQINLVDKDGMVLSSVKTSDILGNNLVKSSSYDDATGILTMVFDNGTDAGLSVEIDLKDLLDVSDVVGDDKYVTATINTDSANDEKQLEISVNVSTDLSAITDTDTLLADAKAVKTYVDAAIKTVSDAADTLTTRVEAVETKAAANEQAIADMDTAYKAADTTLQSNIDTVEAAYKAADAEIVTSYTAADAALEAKITDLGTAYVAADEALKTTYIDVNTAAIEKLNGDEATEGSVAYSIKTTMEDLTNYWEEA